MQKQAIIDYIVNWLKAYCQQAGTDGFVVGVSGGIDSALTSTLVAHTGLNVLCLEMPIYQPEAQVTRAQEHIEWLMRNHTNVQMQRLDLTPTFDSFVNSLPATENKEIEFLSLANTRARLRMMTLYYFAGLHSRLVAGTGNKVEDFGVGFFTKYGDGGVDVSPIADLMKSEVYTLAHHLNINDAILNAKPTDGLWQDDRSDEDQLGASYDELEWAMEFELHKQPNESNLTPRQAEVLSIYRRLHRANLHKMQPIPVCQIPAEIK